MLRAFVSSTYEDLSRHRTKVISDLRRAGIWVDPMEDWEAESDKPREFSVKRVQDCDFCVLLVAFRRGHVPAGENLSITELEYRHAIENGVEVFVFMQEEDDNSVMRRQKAISPQLLRWRADLRERHGVSWFKSEPESIQVLPSVMRWLHQESIELIAPGKKLSCVVPVRNEESQLKETLIYLSKYHAAFGISVFVIDDNSTDSTWKMLTTHCANNHRVRVLRNRYPRRKKMGAIQTGIEVARTEFVILLDADTRLEESRRTIELILHSISDNKEPIDAIAFRIKPAKTESSLQRLQGVEYAISTDSMRRVLDTVWCVSGAASVWRSSSLEQVLSQHSGEFEGDDLELTLLAHELNFTIKQEGRVAASTSTPSDVRSFLSQRFRWHEGFLRLISQARFWKGVFLRPTKVGAIFRGLVVADLILHPLKLFALFYLLIAPQLRNLSGLTPQQVYYFFLASYLLPAIVVGVPSSVIFRGSFKERMKFASLWICYVCSPLLLLSVKKYLLRKVEMVSDPIIEGDHFLNIPETTGFMDMLGEPIVSLIIFSVVWWLPIVLVLSRFSKSRFAREIGVHTVFIPAYFFFQILVITTSAVLTWPAYKESRAGHVLRRLRPALAILCLMITPLALNLGSLLPGDEEGWLATQYRSGPASPISKTLTIKTYQGWREQSWVYDSSLAAMSLIHMGDYRRAYFILEGLRMLQNDDGSWCRAYSTVSPFERLDASKDVTANSFVLMAVLTFLSERNEVHREHDEVLTKMAVKLSEWLKFEATEIFVGQRSYLGMPEFSGSLAISTRATVAAQVALGFAGRVLEAEQLSVVSASLREFVVEVAWDDERGLFTEYSGLGVYTEEPSPTADTQTFSVLALGPEGPRGENFRRALKWCEDNLSISIDLPIGGGASATFSGIIYSRDYPHLIYTQGILQLSSAYFAVGDREMAEKWLGKVEKRMQTKDGGVFYSLGAAHEDFFRRPSVAATAWYIFAKRSRPMNPLAGLSRDRSGTPSS